MKYVLILMMVLFSNQAVALNCAQAPDCAELNYSKENDPNCAEDGYILCPFDTQYKKCVNFNCQGLGFTNNDKTSWCKNIATCPNNKDYTACIKATCEIGDVFYADGSCGLVEDYNPVLGKIPVGVVYYVTDGGYHGKVVNLYELTFDENSNFDPENPFGQSNHRPHFGLGGMKPEINAYTYEELIAALQSHTPGAFAGLENTEILINTKPTDVNCSNGTYQKDTLSYNMYCQATMALAAHQFYPPKVEPTNSVTGQGKWYMPSVGELVLLWNPDMSKLQVSAGAVFPNVEGVIRDKVNETLRFLRNKEVTVGLLSGEGEDYLWSSTYFKSNNYFAVYIRENGKISRDGPTGIKPMRAILQF